MLPARTEQNKRVRPENGDGTCRVDTLVPSSHGVLQVAYGTSGKYAFDRVPREPSLGVQRNTPCNENDN